VRQLRQALRLPLHYIKIENAFRRVRIPPSRPSWGASIRFWTGGGFAAHEGWRGTLGNRIPLHAL